LPATVAFTIRAYPPLVHGVHQTGKDHISTAYPKTVIPNGVCGERNPSALRMPINLRIRPVVAHSQDCLQRPLMLVSSNDRCAHGFGIPLFVRNDNSQPNVGKVDEFDRDYEETRPPPAPQRAITTSAECRNHNVSRIIEINAGTRRERGASQRRPAGKPVPLSEPCSLQWDRFSNLSWTAFPTCQALSTIPAHNQPVRCFRFLCGRSPQARLDRWSARGSVEIALLVRNDSGA